MLCFRVLEVATRDAIGRVPFWTMIASLGRPMLVPCCSRWSGSCQCHCARHVGSQGDPAHDGQPATDTEKVEQTPITLVDSLRLRQCQQQPLDSGEGVLAVCSLPETHLNRPTMRVGRRAGNLGVGLTDRRPMTTDLGGNTRTCFCLASCRKLWRQKMSKCVDSRNRFGMHAPHVALEAWPWVMP